LSKAKSKSNVNQRHTNIKTISPVQFLAGLFCCFVFIVQYLLAGAVDGIIILKSFKWVKI